MFSTDEVKKLSDQWNKVVHAVRSYVRRSLWNQFQISDQGNRYSFHISITCLRKAGVDVTVSVYDYYERYWMIDSDKLMIEWERLK